MGRHTTTQLDAWRQMRATRQERIATEEQRRILYPGGRIPAPALVADPSDYGPILPTGHVSPPGPVAKHVPQNTHLPGSIAWTFFGWGYWRHGAEK